MCLCEACVHLAKDLSDLVSADFNKDYSEKPIRHRRPFAEVRSVENKCSLCWLLQSNYEREDRDSPLDDTFTAEILPIWEEECQSAAAILKRSPQRRLRWLCISVRRENSEPSKVEKVLKGGRNFSTRTAKSA